MKINVSIFGGLLTILVGTFSPCSSAKLENAFRSGKMIERDYEIFKKQLEHRSEINLQSRMDSMELWDLDILYLEEEYNASKKTFTVREYYFSSRKEDSLNLIKKKERWRVYRPDKYFENGEQVNKYFFAHIEAKEQLKSIRAQMQSRKVVDKVDAIIKKEVAHAGCGMSTRWVKDERDRMEKKYRNKKTPNYYLIESFYELDNVNISFQVPQKQKYTVIVEGHSF